MPLKAKSHIFHDDLQYVAVYKNLYWHLAYFVILYLQKETKIAEFRYLRKWTEVVKDKDY